MSDPYDLSALATTSDEAINDYRVRQAMEVLDALVDDDLPPMACPHCRGTRGEFDFDAGIWTRCEPCFGTGRVEDGFGDDHYGLTRAQWAQHLVDAAVAWENFDGAGTYDGTVTSARWNR